MSISSLTQHLVVWANQRSCRKMDGGPCTARLADLIRATSTWHLSFSRKCKNQTRVISVCRTSIVSLFSQTYAVFKKSQFHLWKMKKNVSIHVFVTAHTRTGYSPSCRLFLCCFLYITGHNLQIFYMQCFSFKLLLLKCCHLKFCGPKGRKSTVVHGHTSWHIWHAAFVMEYTIYRAFS